MANPNSALIWLPKIIEAGLPVPRTEIVPYCHDLVMPIFDGKESAELDRLEGAVKDAGEKIGYPVFIRSDLTSAKHSGPKSYRANDAADVGRVIVATVEDNELKTWLDPRGGPQAILVREFLILPAPFTAFHGLPISREWRFFADLERIHCSHPYWPEGPLEGQPGLPENWRELLAELQQPSIQHKALEGMAVQAAAACGGGVWSMDFAQDASGKWWLIDMAVAGDSWHWPGCPNSNEKEK